MHAVNVCCNVKVRICRARLKDLVSDVTVQLHYIAESRDPAHMWRLHDILGEDEGMILSGMKALSYYGSTSKALTKFAKEERHYEQVRLEYV
jgi:hypothetical protein